MAYATERSWFVIEHSDFANEPEFSAHESEEDAEAYAEEFGGRVADFDAIVALAETANAAAGRDEDAEDTAREWLTRESIWSR